jgi:NADH dehydrogenase FAD-containing subunit
MMKSKQRTEVIVLGGGYAGVMAALRLSRKTRGENIHITLVNGADHFVERIRLHQRAANQTIKHYPYSSLLKGTGIRFVQGWVTGLSPARQTVTVHTARGDNQIAYDYLVYALGSFVDTRTVPGAAEHAMSLSTEETTLALQKQLPQIAEQGGRLLVCGGGLTGIEAATELAETYPNLQVTLVTRGTFGEQLSQRGQRHLRQVFDKLGIKVVDNHAVTRVQAHHLECENGATLPFDICLWAGSFTVPSLARHAGLPVNSGGQIIVDAYLRAKTYPNIYVAGDAASLEEAYDIPIRMACATAVPMGAYVGDHLATVIRGEKEARPFRFQYILRCISLGRQDALVQFVEADDRPKERILTGWLGVKTKELVCRGTIWATQFERSLASLLARSPRKDAVESRLAEGKVL